MWFIIVSMLLSLTCKAVTFSPMSITLCCPNLPSDSFAAPFSSSIVNILELYFLGDYSTSLPSCLPFLEPRTSHMCSTWVTAPGPDGGHWATPDGAQGLFSECLKSLLVMLKGPSSARNWTWASYMQVMCSTHWAVYPAQFFLHLSLFYWELNLGYHG